MIKLEHVTSTSAGVLIFNDRRLRGKSFRDFPLINMHRKYGFGPLNHIAGRVKIVLGKKKTDKHTEWASREAAQHPLVCQSRSLRAVHTCIATWNTCREMVEYFAKDIIGEKRVFSYENAGTWRHHGYLGREHLVVDAVLAEKVEEEARGLNFEIYHRRLEAQLDSSR